MNSLGISLVVIVVCIIAMCIIFGVPRLPIRPCDERPPAMYGHFCLVPRVSVHDRYYCSNLVQLFLNSGVAKGGAGGAGGCERTSPNFCSSAFTKNTLYRPNAY